MKHIFKNIKQLVQVRPPGTNRVSGSNMVHLPVVENAFLAEEDGFIRNFGPMSEIPQIANGDSEFREIDCAGRFVLPCFVDSHTHLVFAASRENEFVDKIQGLSYEEIARKGGGILNSARRLQQTSEDELLEFSLPRAREIMAMGTAAVEIKSGYGLTLKDEIKMLRVAQRIGEETPLRIKTTFLGAHAIPKDRTRDDFIGEVINEMIPQVAEEGLAQYCDVFCEEGFFTPEETERIVEKGKEYGLVPKIHANQLHNSGGVQVGVKTNARSVDHLEAIGDEEIEALKDSETMPTLLPGAAFYLNTGYPPARKMIDAGLAVSIATDYNPGSAPSGNMSLMLSLACIKMKMLPEEAINAATINSAYAMDESEHVGSLTKGKDASIIITKEIPSLAFIPYSFGGNVIDQVWIRGQIVLEK